jgi:hypothetical protein
MKPTLKEIDLTLDRHEEEPFSVTLVKGDLDGFYEVYRLVNDRDSKGYGVETLIDEEGRRRVILIPEVFVSDDIEFYIQSLWRLMYLITDPEENALVDIHFPHDFIFVKNAMIRNGLIKPDHSIKSSEGAVVTVTIPQRQEKTRSRYKD